MGGGVDGGPKSEKLEASPPPCVREYMSVRAREKEEKEERGGETKRSEKNIQDRMKETC